jgi:hypothetical protein
VDLLRVVTVPAVVAVLLIMVALVAEAVAAGAPHTGLAGGLVAEAVAAGAPHTGLAGGPVAEVIAGAEATHTATSPVLHATATMPDAELKKYDARSPPRQATTTASPPSLLDFAICISQRNSNL